VRIFSVKNGHRHQRRRAGWTAAPQRLQVAVNGRIHPDRLMPALHRSDGLQRVGSAWRGRPVLDAQQVEDVVAFLRTQQ
jgi:L-cysteine S-thiosulfotransferase